MSQPPVSVPSGTSITREYSIYAGPKDPEQLAAVGRPARSLDRPRLVVDGAAHARLRLAAQGLLRGRPELRRRDHPAHRDGAALHGAACGEADEVDEADGRDPAESEGAPGEVQGRPPAAVPGDDEALQGSRREPARRLPPDGAPDSRLHRPLLRAAEFDRPAPGAVHALDRRPVAPRDALHDSGCGLAGARASRC